MELAAKLDEHGKLAWIGLMVLGFIVFWPIGLAILAFLIWSGRMGCWNHKSPGRWHGRRAERWSGDLRRTPSSGNRAFDEYRKETLRRLEEEQHEFMDFLERLRQAKDKAEFDQFMAERKRQAEAPDAPEAPEAPEGAAPQPQG